MCALIIMAVYDEEGSGRSEYTKRTLQSLEKTVDWDKHKLIIVDNRSCASTKMLYRECGMFLPNTNWSVLYNDSNLGTAKAVNKGLQFRKPGEYCIKMDNDVIIHEAGWVEKMQDVMERMPQIGILGLKRDDLQESPYAINTDQRSRLLMVPHTNEQRWRVVEECKHVMGTCTMLSPALLDRIGYFYQMDGLYGFDDSLMCVRSNMAGFINCFLPGVDIDHLDLGGTAYTDWKAKYAGEILNKYGEVEAAYKSGVRSLYENP